MHRIPVLLLLLMTLQASAQPAAPLRPLLDSALTILQEQALHRHTINWKEFREQAYTATKGIDDIDSLLNRFPLLFERLQDFHGGIQAAKRWISWSPGHPVARRNPALDSAVRKAPALLTQRWGDIGYFRLPGGTTKNIPYVTQMLADSLCKLDPATVKGWIIDLRLNTGGNIWFMLPPLAGLLGDGPIGGINYPNGQPNATTSISEGKVWGNGQWYQVPGQNCLRPSTHIPVVVLVGPKTASSAEGVLLAFKGRTNTLIAGEPTAGLVTSNNTYPLRPSITLVLATGYMMDRQGKPYTTALQPDMTITGGDNFFDLSQDQKIIKAREWLSKRLR